MKRRYHFIIVLTLAVLLVAVMAVGSASASTINSPADGKIYIGIPSSISYDVKTGYSSNRVDYVYVRVYDADGNMLLNDEREYDGSSTVITGKFLPKKAGTYIIESCTYYMNTVNGNSFPVSSSKRDSVKIQIYKKSDIGKVTPKFSATSDRKGNVTIKFKDKGVTGHTIYRATSLDGTYKKIGTTTKSSFTDKGCGQRKYYYRVKDYVTIDGVKKFSKYSSKKTVDCRASQLKSELETRDNYYGITIVDSGSAWKYADGTEIWRSTTKSGTYKKIATIKNGNYYVDKTVKERIYYYKLRPYTTVDGKKIYGKYSDIKGYYFTKSEPEVTAPVPTVTPTEEGIEITWKATDGVTFYTLYRSDYKSLGQFQLGDTFKYVDKTAKAGDSYSYSIRTDQWYATSENSSSSVHANSEYVPIPEA